jgi:hypothetical protein
MSKQEEMRRREALAEKSALRQRENPSAESLRSAFYAALYHSSASLEENVGTA